LDLPSRIHLSRLKIVASPPPGHSPTRPASCYLWKPTQHQIPVWVCWRPLPDPQKQSQWQEYQSITLWTSLSFSLPIASLCSVTEKLLFTCWAYSLLYGHYYYHWESSSITVTQSLGIPCVTLTSQILPHSPLCHLTQTQP
jgi:hypothetical protein